MSKSSWRISLKVSRMIGNEPNCLATLRRSAALRRCSHSGVRLPGPSPGEEQSTPGCFTEPGREHRGVGEVVGEKWFEFVRVEDQLVG